MVHITKGGSVYHRAQHCEALRDGQRFADWKRQEVHDVRTVARSVALSEGRGACEVCRPDLPRPSR